MNTGENNNKRRGKRVLIIILKTILWIIGVPVFLLIVIFIALQFSGPQKFVTDKATGFLSDKIKTKVSLKEINIALPKSIALSDLYVEDEKGDTLLYSHLIKVDLNFWDLLDKKIGLNSVTLETLTGHISRDLPNGKFNFSFIPDAFASKDTTTVKEPVDTTAAGWQFSIKNVSLKNIYFTFHDRSGGMNADLHLGTFETGFDKFDLDKKIIHVGTVALKNTRASVLQSVALYKAPEDTTASQPFDYDLALGKLELENVTAVYNDKVALQDLNVKLGRFLLEPKNIDIKNEKIALKTVLLHNTEIYYTQNKTAIADTVVAKAEDLAEKKPNWILTLGNLDLENNTVGFNNGQKAPLKKGMDFDHLLAKNIIIKANDIDASASRVSVNLKALSLEEQSGFILKKFTSKITYDSTHVDLADLELRANNTVIKDHLGISYSSLKTLSDSIGRLGLAINLNKTSIAVKDILFFMPGFFETAHLKKNESTVINISGKITGKINDLSISKLDLSTLQQTSVKLNGNIKNVMDPKNMYASLTAFEIKSSKNDIAAVLPDTLLPASINLPESFGVSGSYKGYVKNFDADLAVNTTIGNITATVKMNPGAGNKEQPYSGKVNITEFDLGKLLNQQTLGPVTMSASVKGSGFDTSNINTALSVGISKATFKNYAYSNFQLDGTMIKKSFNGKAVMNDKNLAFNFNGGADLEPAHPKYTFTLDLAGVDLKALNLSDEDVRISALISSDIGNGSGRNPTGKASIKNALVIRNNRKYPVDSIVLTSEFKDGISDIRLRSEIITADFNGEISLKELPATLTQQINSYFNLQQQAASVTPTAKQKFKFNINLVDPTLLTNNLVPGLEKLTPSAIDGNYDSEAKIIRVNLSVPQVKYSGITVDSLKFDVISDPSKLDYDIKIAEVSNPTLKFENVFLGGELKNNTLSFQFNTAKDDSAKLLAIGGLLKSINQEFELKLDKDLIINTQNWNIDGSNYLMFGKQGMYANNVVLSNGGQSVGLNSKEKVANAPLEIKFKDFDIATVSRLIENKKDLLKGNIDGNVILEKQNNASAFKSDIVIRNFEFQAVPIGTIKVKADNYEDANKYDVDLSIEGNGNDIAMKGFYNAGKESNLNFILDIRNLELKTIEPFTSKQVTRMSGSLNGKLTVKGQASLPDINGSLAFKDAAFNPGIIDSYLKVDDSKLTFDSKKIRFNNFVLRDSLNQQGSVNGVVDIQDLKNIKLDLRVKTDNFLALNTTKKSNPLYYGTVFLDSDIRISGTSSAPTLDVKAKLNKGSSITYVKPESEVGKNESKGIVEFENNHPDKNIAIMARQNDSINGISETKGIDLNASINVDRSVQLKMIVDPASGDSLFILGGGLLDFSLDRSGKTNLSGKYSINDGGYFLSLENLVKRNFQIQKGSSVTWSGDILDAYVDLTAIYTIKTSPIDLVQDELSGVSELEKNKYRNMLTFKVYLKMTGFISAPEISFDIQLAPEDRGALNGAVNSKLSQLREDETQLNKQVFALLTLRRFIGENPLESGSDGGLSSASRSSASKVLTQQLSSLSSKYVNFVDLDLGVNSFEDYSSGSEQGRTQLQVGVSKQLFNEKITVRVGGNVDLEGERASQNSVNDVAGNVSVDYKLTDDGRYKLKGFRQNQYENPIEGELTKTGVGVVFVRNFNTFKQLFRSPKNGRAKRKENNLKDDDDNR